MKKHVREFQSELKAIGLKLVGLSQTGKGHFKATIEGPDKRQMVYILAGSPSDRRASINRTKDVQRFFNT